MATFMLTPLGEYLTTAYHPDCDFVSGEVQERNLGEYDHANLQGTIAFLLRSRAQAWRIRVVPEVRVQVAADRFRIPDVCVMSMDAPREQIIRHPPLVCIEVLSPEDRLSRTKERIRDFIDMGVSQVWLFDPGTRTAMVCDDVSMVEYRSGELSLPGTSIVLSLHEVFSALDE